MRTRSSSASTGAPSPATRRRSARKWDRTSPSTSMGATACSTRFTSTGTAGSTTPARTWTTRHSARTRSSPPAGRRTTRAAGSTTVTSSATRTPGWPAGTWWNRKPRRREPPMRTAASVVVIASLAVDAPAMAAKYPPAKDPPGVQKAPKGPHHTLQVGKHAKYKTIIAAVKAAKAGDTIRVAHGTYKGQVKIAGAAKRYIQIIGDVKHPEKVIVELKGLHGAKA